MIDAFVVELSDSDERGFEIHVAHKILYRFHIGGRPLLVEFLHIRTAGVHTLCLEQLDRMFHFHRFREE